MWHLQGLRFSVMKQLAADMGATHPVPVGYNGEELTIVNSYLEVDYTSKAQFAEAISRVIAATGYAAKNKVIGFHTAYMREAIAVVRDTTEGGNVRVSQAKEFCYRLQSILCNLNGTYPIKLTAK